MIQENQKAMLTFEDVRDKIKFHKKHYHHVFLMFRMMNKKKLSFIEGHHFFLLRNKYEKAYVQLLRELDPMRYELYLEERAVLSGKVFVD